MPELLELEKLETTKILGVGKLECEHCKDGKLRKGEDGTKEKRSDGYRYFWPERWHLCLKHLREFLMRKMKPVPEGKLWPICFVPPGCKKTPTRNP